MNKYEANAKHLFFFDLHKLYNHVMLSFAIDKIDSRYQNYIWIFVPTSTLSYHLDNMILLILFL